MNCYFSSPQGFFKHLKIPFLGTRQYYNIVGTYVYKSIWGSMLVEQNVNLEELKVAILPMVNKSTMSIISTENFAALRPAIF